MRRRTVLALSASVLAAGCVDGGPADATTEQTPSDTQTASPGESDATGVSLTAESDALVSTTGDDTVESIRFVLTNRTAGSLRLDPASWVIERESAEGWTEIAAGDDDGDERTVPSDGTHTWSLSLTTHPTPASERRTFVFENLAEGTYRFGVSARRDGTSRTRRARFTVRKRAATDTRQ